MASYTYVYVYTHTYICTPIFCTYICQYIYVHMSVKIYFIHVHQVLGGLGLRQRSESFRLLEIGDVTLGADPKDEVASFLFDHIDGLGGSPPTFGELIVGNVPEWDVAPAKRGSACVFDQFWSISLVLHDGRVTCRASAGLLERT